MSQTFTILVAEDEAANAELIKDLLESRSFQVLCASNGQEATEIATNNLPDLILMDLRMPKLNGLQATRTLKNNDDTKNIPVVALTASVMDGTEQKVFDGGCVGYIKKPITVATFVDELKEYLPVEKT